MRVVAKTYNEFLDSYNDNLSEHLERYEDNCELTFLNEQLYYYMINIEVCEYILYDSSSIDQERKEYLEELKNIIQKNILMFYKYSDEVVEESILWDRLHISSDKIVKLIESKIQSFETRPKEKTNMLKWQGTPTEFIELIKALIENGNIKGTQADIISNLSNVFNVEIKYPNKLITDIKKRNNGSETLFLDRLKKTLLNYITQENYK